MPSLQKPDSPLRDFSSSPEVIRFVALMYTRFSLSLRDVEDLLSERGIDICHDAARMWWIRFDPLLANEIKRQRIRRTRRSRASRNAQKLARSRIQSIVSEARS